MAYVADQIKAKIPVPLIEPAAAALKVAELLYSLNLKQSKYLIYKA
jgi:Asp/Glu/hydantoin racemase